MYRVFLYDFEIIDGDDGINDDVMMMMMMNF